MRPADEIAALKKRIDDLEAQVRLLNARPQQVVYPPTPPHVPVWPIPVPTAPVYPALPWIVTCGPSAGETGLGTACALS